MDDGFYSKESLTNKSVKVNLTKSFNLFKPNNQ